MNLFYIKAKATVRVAGISGPFEKTTSHLVPANSLDEARIKFEKHVSATHANMQYQSIKFEYLEVATQIA